LVEGDVDFSTLPDDELLRLFVEEAIEAAMEEIFNRYSHLVYGLCMSIVRDGEIARDLVITVFEKLLKSVAGSGVRNLKSWLLVVARNECYLYFRKTKHKTISLDSDEVNFASVEGLTVEEATADPLEKERMLDQVVAGLDMLSLEQNICLNMLYLQGKTYQEICESTGYTFGQVKSYVQNGKRNLKIILEDDDQE
jgi:RNA polymerase sigma factor, sigma-70 family